MASDKAIGHSFGNGFFRACAGQGCDIDHPITQPLAATFFGIKGRAVTFCG